MAGYTIRHRNEFETMLGPSAAPCFPLHTHASFLQMSTGVANFAQARASLSERLHTRRAEIEEAILTRVYGVSDTSGINDPEYAEGLRAAVSVAVVYGLAAIEQGDERVPPVPPVLLLQARTAARSGVSLDTVLRRYVAGYGLLGDFLIEEVVKDRVLGEQALKESLRVQTAILDRLLAAVSEEYAREADARMATSETRRVERVERLLAGELVDTSPLGYDFDGAHVGLIVDGPRALETVRALDASLDCRMLIVPRREMRVWAWLGARRELDPRELEAILEDGAGETSIAIGEPARGLRGWRLTHAQARATLTVAMRRQGVPIRYRDAALLASMLQDDLLCISLHELYLSPLEKERDGGVALRETLRAYLTAERNVSSAASALGVSRRTVTNRLRMIEEKIDQPLYAALSDVEAALRLDELDRRESEDYRES